MTRIVVASRLVAAAVIAVGAGAAVTGGVAFGWMPHVVAPAVQKVTPAAADAVLTCSGPLLAIGRDATAAAKISVAGAAAVTVAGQNVTQGRLKTPDISGEAGSVRLVASAKGRTVPQVSGASSVSIAADDLGGFAANACAPALMDSWVVGGSTMSGAADLIALANPGQVAATVDLTMFGKDGQTQPAGGNSIVIAPGTEEVIPLAGLGIGEDAPVVRVTATGAPVRAALQSSLSRGLSTSGVDQSGVVSVASSRLVVTGVHVTREQQDDPTTVVRLLAPDHDATAQVTVVGVHGTTGPAQQVPLSQGTPVELQLPLAVGDYSIVVTADKPVVGAAWQATGTAAGDDFTWIEPAPALAAGRQGTQVTVPAGPSPRLDLLPDGSQPVKLTLAPVGGGAAQTVTVPAQQASSVPLQAGLSYRITATGAVHAAVSFVGDKALASFPVWPPATAAAPVTVYR